MKEVKIQVPEGYKAVQKDMLNGVTIKFEKLPDEPKFKVGDMVKVIRFTGENYHGNCPEYPVSTIFIVGMIEKSVHTKVGCWLFKKDSDDLGISEHLCDLCTEEEKLQYYVRLAESKGFTTGTKYCSLGYTDGIIKENSWSINLDYLKANVLCNRDNYIYDIKEDRWAEIIKELTLIDYIKTYAEDVELYNYDDIDFDEDSLTDIIDGLLPEECFGIALLIIKDLGIKGSKWFINYNNFTGIYQLLNTNYKTPLGFEKEEGGKKFMEICGTQFLDKIFKY